MHSHRFGARLIWRANLAYAVITTWKRPGNWDEAEAGRIMQEQFFPAMQAAGATQCMSVRTGEDTSALVVIYPDKATRDAAAEKIAASREKAVSTFAVEMTSEIMGDVIVSF